MGRHLISKLKAVSPFPALRYSCALFVFCPLSRVHASSHERWSVKMSLPRLVKGCLTESTGLQVEDVYDSGPAFVGLKLVV